MLTTVAMVTDKHATIANATVGVFFGVRSGDDVMQQQRIGDDAFFGVRSGDDVIRRCFLCGLFTGYITKGTS
jgi:hypothetical protein